MNRNIPQLRGRARNDIPLAVILVDVTYFGNTQDQHPQHPRGENLLPAGRQVRHPGGESRSTTAPRRGTGQASFGTTGFSSFAVLTLRRQTATEGRELVEIHP